jgi:hypothetical protein
MATNVIDGMAGDNSKTALVETTADPDAISNAQLVSGVPAGRLLTFLSDSYVDATEVTLAFNALGGALSVLCVGGTASTSDVNVGWVAAASTPSLTIIQPGAVNALYALQISLMQSIPR